MTEREVFGLAYGCVVRHLRKQKGLSQEELAAMLEISQPTLSRFEAGVHLPGAFLYGRLAEALNSNLKTMEQTTRAIMDKCEWAAAAINASRPLHTYEPVAVTGLVEFAAAVHFTEGF